MRPELVGHYLYGRLHGGVISATLDAMGGLALMVAIGEKHADETTQQVMHRFAKMSTIDLRVDYLRPGIGTSFIATAASHAPGRAHRFDADAPRQRPGHADRHRRGGLRHRLSCAAAYLAAALPNCASNHSSSMCFS